jgi:anti-sigma factor RsiW
MTRRDYTIRDIHMALDGEMPIEEREAFEIWLAANPDMKALSARFAADAKRLRETFAGILNEPVPDRLTGLVTGGQPRSVSWLPSWRTAAAAAAIFAIGAAGGYLAASDGLLSRARGENQLAETAIGAYVTYAADPGHAVEVGASDKSYLENWLSKRTGLKLVAPDLTAEGFELLGGRILPSEQRPAALLVYRDQTGSHLSIYVTAEGEAKTRGTYTQAAGGPTAIYWLDKDYGCAIVSSLPEEQLNEVARSAWRQLVEGARASGES